MGVGAGSGGSLLLACSSSSSGPPTGTGKVTISLTVQGTDGGYVTSTPPGIACGNNTKGGPVGACSFDFTLPVQIVLKASGGAPGAVPTWQDDAGVIVHGPTLTIDFSTFGGGTHGYVAIL
jgi:hypothetical protein